MPRCGTGRRHSRRTWAATLPGVLPRIELKRLPGVFRARSHRASHVAGIRTQGTRTRPAARTARRRLPRHMPSSGECAGVQRPSAACSWHPRSRAKPHRPPPAQSMTRDSAPTDTARNMHSNRGRGGRTDVPCCSSGGERTLGTWQWGVPRDTRARGMHHHHLPPARPLGSPALGSRRGNIMRCGGGRARRSWGGWPNSGRAVLRLRGECILPAPACGACSATSLSTGHPAHNTARHARHDPAQCAGTTTQHAPLRNGAPPV